jgi:hypothetical protein
MAFEDTGFARVAQQKTGKAAGALVIGPIVPIRPVRPIGHGLEQVIAFGGKVC